MFKSLGDKPFVQTSQQVSSVSKRKGEDGSTHMEVTIPGLASLLPTKYSHVVSTVSLSCLRAINLAGCGLDYNQKTALRSLRYGTGVKVGIKFKTRWWQGEASKKQGGSSKTDRQSRVVVYPNYGLDAPADTPGVLIATYTWYVPPHTVETSAILRFHNSGTKTPSALLRSLCLKTGARMMLLNLQVWIQNSHLRLRRSSSSTRYMKTWPRSMVGPQVGTGTRHLHIMRTTGTITVIPWVVTHFSDLGNLATFIRKSPSQPPMDTFISVEKPPAAITPGSRGRWIRHGGVFGKFSLRTELRSRRKSSARRIRTRYLTT